MIDTHTQASPIIYILSDSIGETGEIVLKAALSQFDGGQAELKRIPYLSSTEQIGETLMEAREKGGIVIHTIVRPDLNAYLKDKADELRLVHVDIMNPIIDALKTKMSLPPKYEPGLIRKVDKAYYEKMEAIEFAVRFDDGKEPQGLLKADLILTGISRTSKTPLCMYLAHKGVKAANVPLVPDVQPPAELFKVPPHKIVGLVIKPSLLIEIRKERLKVMGLAQTTEYANIERIFAELDFATEIMRKIGCPIIDVTNKAMEETAAKLLEIYKGGGVS